MTEDLQRRQEELERKAAELQRKEQQLAQGQYGSKFSGNLYVGCRGLSFVQTVFELFACIERTCPTIVSTQSWNTQGWCCL